MSLELSMQENYTNLSNFMKKNISTPNMLELSQTNMPKHPKESLTRGQDQIKETLLETLVWIVT